jgi:hypothetical protein
MLPSTQTGARARFVSLLLAATAYAVNPSVAAAEPSVSVASAELEVVADSHCTTRADLIERVRIRSPRVRFVDNGSALAIRVRFSRIQSGALAGDITLASPSAKPALRHVLAGSCTEAADAVALIIAVSAAPAIAPRAHGCERPVRCATRAASGLCP